MKYFGLFLPLILMLACGSAPITPEPAPEPVQSAEPSPVVQEPAPQVVISPDPVLPEEDEVEAVEALCELIDSDFAE